MGHKSSPGQKRRQRGNSRTLERVSRFSLLGKRVPRSQSERVAMETERSAARAFSGRPSDFRRERRFCPNIVDELVSEEFIRTRTMVKLEPAVGFEPTTC